MPHNPLLIAFESLTHGIARPGPSHEAHCCTEHQLCSPCGTHHHHPHLYPPCCLPQNLHLMVAEAPLSPLGAQAGSSPWSPSSMLIGTCPLLCSHGLWRGSSEKQRCKAAEVSLWQRGTQSFSLGENLGKELKESLSEGSLTPALALVFR